MKIFTRLSFLFILSATFYLQACKKSGIDAPVTPELPDLQTVIASSASGFVTNENNEPVSGATVKLGTNTIVTDQYGYFEFTAIQVIKTAALISVEQNGYFKAFRSYAANEGRATFVRIKLLHKTVAGTINASTGGEVNLPDGLTITIPANAVVDEGTGAAYNGNISVAANWTDAASGEHLQTMPGDNRGLDTDGVIKSLSSYGITAVDLTADGGQHLQVAPGKKATLKIPVNTAVYPSAPASIPLWHFNETNGLWEEEGMATKSGSFYIAEVSHFSFWNCSWPADPVNFYVRIIDSAGEPVPFAYVKLTEVGNTGNAGAAFTDPDGIAFGVVPANTNFTMSVTNGYGCGVPVFTQQVQTGNGVSLGNVSLPASAMATVTGNALDCSLQNVTNGYVIMNYEGTLSRYNISTAAPFTFNTVLCGNGIQARFTVADLQNLQESTPLIFAVYPGLNQLGGLQACGVNTMEFVNYTINGTTVNITSPTGVFSFGAIPAINSTLVQGADTTTGQAASTAFSYPGTALGSDQLLTKIDFNPGQDSLTISSPIYVHITQYDAPGGFIAGNYAGILAGMPPGNLSYNISCSFKVRRSF